MTNIIVQGTELYHFGIKGQKWGERRYQYEDGSLTPEGRQHYGYGEAKARDRAKRAKEELGLARKIADRRISYDKERMDRQGKGVFNYREKRLNKTTKKMNAYVDAMKKKADKRQWQADNYEEYKKDKVKKAAIAGAAIVGTALAAYGTYKLADYLNDKKATKTGNDYVKNIWPSIKNMPSGKFVSVPDTEKEAWVKAYNSVRFKNKAKDANKIVYFNRN